MVLKINNKFAQATTFSDEESLGEIDGINYWLDPNYNQFSNITYGMGRVLHIVNKLNNIQHAK
jgi:hypothetical protein